MPKIRHVTEFDTLIYSNEILFRILELAIGAHYVGTFMSTMRGTTLNLHNRFETRSTETFDDGWERFEVDLELPVIQTQFIPDQTKSIISYNESPDLPMMASINPYRGCEHGCAYCYARPSHEYLGYNSALDFETKILVKDNAPELLRKEMLKSS